MAWQQFACAHCGTVFRFDDAPRPARCPSCRGLVRIPTGAGRWYYARGRQKVGPLGLDGLRGLAAVGRLSPADMVWQEDTVKWLPAGTVPGLFAVPVAVVAPRKRRLLPFALAALVLAAVTASVAFLTWRTSAPAAPRAGQPVEVVRAEPAREKLPAPKEAEPLPPPAELPEPPAPKPPDPPPSKPAEPEPAPPAPVALRSERAILSPADEPSALTVRERAVARVNAYRAQAGLEPVLLDPGLTSGCQAHCEYLARNAGHPSTVGLGGHDEDASLPGYSEEGRRAGRASVLAWGDVEPLAALDGWMATLYHRVPILDPSLKRIGFGHARRGGGWVTALDVLRGREPGPAAGVVLYPAPDQTRVPLTLSANEEPDPIPQAKARRAGFPVTATFPAGATLTQMSFALHDDAGRDVPVWFSSPEKPANPAFAQHQGTTVCLIARKPLRPGTTYTVRGAGQVDGQPWSRAWSFATGQGTAGERGASAP
jgi:uncharacterized protein YkwD